MMVTGTVYPSYRLMATIEVSLHPGTFDAQGNSLESHLTTGVSNGWRCDDVNNYTVESKVGAGKTHRVNIAAVWLNLKCDKDHPQSPPTVTLVLGEMVDLRATYTVTVSVDSVTAVASGLKFAAAAPSPTVPPTGPRVFSFNAAAVSNEPLTNGAYKSLQQFTAAYADPSFVQFGQQSSIYLNSNNLFSTNERDQKSSFAVAVGYQHGLFSGFYLPFKIEQSVTGNQVATSLSAVTTASLSAELPWSGTGKVLNNNFISVPVSPELSLNFPYTHRFNQVVKSGGTPLETNDFSIVPAAAFAHNRFLPGVCHKYQSWLVGLGTPAATKGSDQFCLGFEADFGLYYLPRDLTSKGNQRVEGYGDFSFLVPLTDFQFPFIPDALSAQALQTQLRIKYEDSVSATNNYARTKKWSFGVELIK
jgi:hypothetical protein